MLDKTIYEFILSKANSETTGYTFKGNHLFVRINDTQTLVETSTYNAYDVKANKFIAMAESTSQPTPFTEANNRIGWIKRYVFQFTNTMRDDALSQLQELYKYFRDNQTHTITDDGDTLTYNVKVSPPTFVSNEQQAGGISHVYYMDFLGETVETGYFGNTATHKMALDGNALQDIIIDEVFISFVGGNDPSNVLTSETNTSNKIISSGVTIDMKIYYDSTALLETLLDHIQGKHSRTQIYDYSLGFDGDTDTYELHIQKGNVVYKNGRIVMLNITFIEV